MKHIYLLLILFLSLAASTARAQNLLLDGDFSNVSINTLGTGNANGTGARVDFNNEGTTGNPNQYQYDYQASVSTYNIGVTAGTVGGWTFTNTGGAGNSAIYLIYTDSAYSQNWIPQAAASNTNGYVVQLDSVSQGNNFTTGNAALQTVSVTSGSTYSLTFSINTESGSAKAGTSAADVMVTNSTLYNDTGSSGTISVSSTTNLNAKTYGDVTGYQYKVTTTGNGGSATTWATYTLDFTATSNSVQIALADDPLSMNSNISLENIILTAIPEPREGSWLVLLAMVALMYVRKFQSSFSKSRFSASL